ncbi:hypothetical protein [Arthrobacter sp. SLBN-122]|uniref:hypothetical protein n=1 Tax=Arthrobacter sp. SLBN-122 TaxID=2768455 RepID=UPI00114E5428|nr:hypothetical protein [Arthrobacter sp. SLBN-122]
MTAEELEQHNVSATTVKGKPRKNNFDFDEVPVVQKKASQRVQVTQVNKRSNRKYPAVKTSDGSRLSFRDQDEVGLKLLHGYMLLTLAHFAYHFDTTIDAMRKRVNKWINAGFIESDHTYSVRVNRILPLGLAWAGIDDTVPKIFPRPSTYQHTLLAASVGIILAKGGPNAALLTDGLFTAKPKVVFPERLLQLATSPKLRDQQILKSNWLPDRMQFLSEKAYPSVETNRKDYMKALDRAAYEHAEQGWMKTMEDIWVGSGSNAGYLHLLTHPDHLGQHGQTHRADGAVALPNIMFGDDNEKRRSGTWLYEVEVTMKPKGRTVYRRTLAQEVEMVKAGIIDGVLWFVDENNREIRRAINGVLDELVKAGKLSQVMRDEHFKIRPFFLLNGNANAHGFLG